MRHDVTWHAPSPLWSRALEDAGPAPERFRRPALLRFDSEAFMDTVEEVLRDTPEELTGYVAAPETWRAPAAGWRAASEAAGSGPVKLFQPAHDRFYLVAASLVCRLHGLPERRVDAGAGESVGFLVRRIEPAVAGAVLDPDDPGSWTESAWIGDRQRGRWQAVADPEAPAEGEERLPLFPVAFELEGTSRRLHAGLVPVAGREVYEGGAPEELEPSAAELAGDPLADPRRAAFESRVLGPLAALGELDTADDVTGESAREAFLFTLLDWAELLQQELERVWTGLTGSAAVPTPEEQHVLTLLDRPVGAATWGELLTDTEDHRREILLGEPPPDLRVVELGLTRPQIAAAADDLVGAGLADAVADALGEPPEPEEAEGETAPEEAPEAASPEGAVYVIRCVYERPACLGVVPPRVSRPSEPFRFAPFFDPDAPVRPSRIRLPLDTSLAGLRRFPRQVSFLLSNELRRQAQRVSGLGVSDVEDGDLNPDGGPLGLGMVCTLSIPIITICAFLLLTIIVQLLNIVFWWLPLFKVCLPIRLGGRS